MQLATVNLSSLVHFKSWQELIENLREVDKMLMMRMDLNNQQKQKCRLFIVVNLPFLLRVVMEEVIWNLTEGVEKHKYFFYMNFNRYFCFISNIVMIYINVLMNRRYKWITELLKNLFRARILTKHDIIMEIRIVQKLFLLLTNVTKLYSKIFGYQIFFELLYMHMAMLQRLVGSLVSSTVATAVFTGNGNRILQYLSLDGIIFNIVGSQYSYINQNRCYCVVVSGCADYNEL